jgi:hypothetical protein
MGPIASAPIPILEFRAGQFYTAYCATTGQTALTQNTIYAHPFFVPYNYVFKSIGVLATGVASSQADLGIYNDGGGLPTTLLADYGAVATTTTGFKTIAINQALTAGWYWLAVAVQGANGTLKTNTGTSTGGQVGNPNPNATSYFFGFAGNTSVTGALPAQWGTTLTGGVLIPVVYLGT